MGRENPTLTTIILLLLVTLFAKPTILRALAGDSSPVHPLQLLVDALRRDGSSIRTMAEAGGDRPSRARMDDSLSGMPPVNFLKAEKRRVETEGAGAQAEATVESDTGGKAWQGGSWMEVARQKRRDGREGKCQQVRPSRGKAMDVVSAVPLEERATRAEGHSREREHGKQPQAESAGREEGGREAEEASSEAFNHTQPQGIEGGHLGDGGKAAVRRSLGVTPSREEGGYVEGRGREAASPEAAASAATAALATSAALASSTTAAEGESSARRRSLLVKGWTTSRWERDESFIWGSDEDKEKMVGLRDQPYTWHWPIEAVGDTWRLPSSKPLRRVNLRVRRRKESRMIQHW